MIELSAEVVVTIKDYHSGVGLVKVNSYSEFLNMELNSHQQSGAFRQNTLFTKAVADADLDPKDAEPYPAALPIHVHEYIHYLHNISTPPGLLFMVNELFFIFEFIKGTDELGDYDPSRVKNHIYQYMADTNDVLNGRVIASNLPKDVKIKHWSFSEPLVTGKKINIQGEVIEGLSVTSIVATAEDYDAGKYEVSFNVGLTLITEGVAYEIDREIRREIGLWSDLDKDVPGYPYLMYRHLVDFLLGKKSSFEERVVLGTCALSSPSPGCELLRACSELGTGSLDGAQFNNYLKQIQSSLGSFYSEFHTKMAPQILIHFNNSPLINRGLRDYLSIISSATECRLKCFALELNLSQIKDVANFREFIASVAPQWISQEASDGARLISWHGNKEIVESIDESAISTLQSIFHYMQVHMLSNGQMLATKDISGVECPFSGACQAQVDNNYPIECRTKPWEVNLQLPEASHVCFYNSGVRSLFEQGSINS